MESSKRKSKRLTSEPHDSHRRERTRIRRPFGELTELAHVPVAVSEIVTQSQLGAATCGHCENVKMSAENLKAFFGIVINLDESLFVRKIMQDTYEEAAKCVDGLVERWSDDPVAELLFDLAKTFRERSAVLKGEIK